MWNLDKEALFCYTLHWTQGTSLCTKERKMNLTGNVFTLILGLAIPYVLTAYENYSIGEEKRYRQDGRTPAGVHSIFAAMLVLHEPYLLWKEKTLLALVLLLHDILEDTDRAIPVYIPSTVKELVANEMIYPGGGSEEREKIWGKSRLARLAKMYDKYSNLLTARPGLRAWQKIPTHVTYLRKLADVVESEWDIQLEIIFLARELCDRREKEWT